jgi:hypothetical protein
MAMQKEIKNTLIVGNPSRTINDVLKSENTKGNKTKVILRTEGQGIKDYFLYHTISKF